MDDKDVIIAAQQEQIAQLQQENSELHTQLQEFRALVARDAAKLLLRASLIGRHAERWAKAMLGARGVPAP